MLGRSGTISLWPQLCPRTAMDPSHPHGALERDAKKAALVVTALDCSVDLLNVLDVPRNYALLINGSSSAVRTDSAALGGRNRFLHMCLCQQV